jgi:dolichyl-phosphate beta-glucosyltransferase
MAMLSCEQRYQDHAVDGAVDTLPVAGTPGMWPELSVVVPCYNAAGVLGHSLSALTAHLGGLDRTWEIVLVDDGSEDGTWEVAVAAAAADARVTAVRLPANRGKGRAVSEGMARARGRCRIFTDADLPYRLDVIDRCAGMILDGPHAAVFGSRRLADSDASAQSLLRRCAGGIVQRLAGRLLGTAMDTQCGFKGFSAEIAEELFPLLTIDGFLFDVEAALLLTRTGVPIAFVPVELVNQSPSTISLLGTGFHTLREAWRIWSCSRGAGPDLTRLRAIAEAA